ncbi:hypothetical protein O6H91_04G087200 [Diphasiastrum complanatum]|uniref:Uncharacterized protein n=1 Tax=Diphasiastrum complanatum TaxID=34168 RepID=A0ACC2DZ52_DIPCM|nr:hypothetical protein O6H91_04G087200 [Diphasiastrum complanatum]
MIVGCADGRDRHGIVQQLASPILNWVDFHQFSRATNFQCFASTGNGAVIVGSKDEKIRLCSTSTMQEQAKTVFPGLGSPIKNMDVTFDGKWILGTTDNYMILIRTVFKDKDDKTKTGSRLVLLEEWEIELQRPDYLSSLLLILTLLVKITNFMVGNFLVSSTIRAFSLENQQRSEALQGLGTSTSIESTSPIRAGAPTLYLATSFLTSFRSPGWMDTRVGMGEKGGDMEHARERGNHVGRLL